eukprot:jgi/Mesen1/5868/ME000298S05131
MSRALLQRAVRSPFLGTCQRRGYADGSVAARLLDSAKLKSGDVVIQNEADTEVGKEVIKLAKERGLKTVNVIADKPGTADLVEKLKQLGGDIVITEAYTNTWFVKRLLSDLPAPTLALNSSSGSLATAVAKLVAPGGTLVTYGKELPSAVAYPGAERRPLAWSEFLKKKEIVAKSL